MEIVFEHNNSVLPKVSIILLDWSCRESFHIFHYINNQTVPRDQYEVIWIEYYDRRSPEITAELESCKNLNKLAIVDKWIVMEIANNVYYHKHLMYNIGIVESKGEIVVLCDSDAMLSPTFVETIIKSFEEDSNIVLHLDQVRNVNKRFYPFNYPPIEEVLGEGCINWKDGKTTGLLDKDDALHTRNYGACFCALKEDLINIGGADEHIDYLGHICGPYEMTFRLVNLGKKEIWHQEEFLYHLWHPGTDGDNNYMGPHDGRNMSTTALEAQRTGRVTPLVENPAINLLRLKQDDIIYEPLLLQAIPEEDIKDWTVEKLREDTKSRYLWNLGNFLKHPIFSFQLITYFFKMLTNQFTMKITKFSRQSKSLKDLIGKIFKTYDFFKNMSQYNNYIIERCDKCLKKFASNDTKEFAVYGTGDIAEVLYILSLHAPVKIKAFYDRLGDKKFHKFNVMPLEAIKPYSGKVVIAALVGAEDMVELLKIQGLKRNQIVLL